MKSFIFNSLLVLFSLIIGVGSLSAQDAANGKKLFGQCAACHNKSMKADLTGPALGGVQERWADYPKEDLYSWIRNSQGLIASGHPEATKLWAKWGPTVMSQFPALSDSDIDDILLYIDNVYTVGCAVPPCAPTETEGRDGVNGASAGGNNMMLFGILLAFLALLAFILFRIVSSLKNIEAEASGATVEKKTLAQTLMDKKTIGLLIFVGVLIGGYFTVNGAINLNRQQGYQPDQPIAFSHELHAGTNEIDCQYCHDGARRSKHSVIPATNTCMNCHKAIKYKHEYEEDEKKKLGSKKEIAKIYASSGFSPTQNKYLDESASREYKFVALAKYLVPNELKEALDMKLSEVGEAQYDKVMDVVKSKLGSSYVSQLNSMIGKPIEWVRIHNLPDHVYFNHAQHVTVGKIECQQCHGKVEEMEVLEQYSPLSMGWCVNCHRETEVQFSDNGYYKDTEYYEKYHNQLLNGDVDKVTVEMIGGLECQKCHY